MQTQCLKHWSRALIKEEETSGAPETETLALTEKFLESKAVEATRTAMAFVQSAYLKYTMLLS
jgi:hypothetical protein